MRSAAGTTSPRRPISSSSDLNRGCDEVAGITAGRQERRTVREVSIMRAHPGHLGLIGAAGIATLVLAAVPARAEDYPSRPVSLVVAFPAGGGVDTVGRVVAQKLTDALGQQVIVVNRPGRSEEHTSELQSLRHL